MMDLYVLSPYVAPLLFFLIAAFIGFFLVGLSWFRSHRQSYREKCLPYECGFDAFTEGEFELRNPFSIHYYKVAILFVVFDIEVVFVLPFVVSLKELPCFALCSMLLFLFILAIGFVYEWGKGGLSWE